MKPIAFQGIAAAVCAANALACGGDLAGEGAEPTGSQTATLASLETDAAVRRTYLGVTQEMTARGRAAVGIFDLVGGADVDVELATKNGAPLVADLWQVHVDREADLVFTVDEPSGFALHAMHADEDSRWLLRLPPGRDEDVVVHVDCVGGRGECAPLQQPGESCPAGWSCDEGLVCKVPGDVCVAP